jgi:hypothetical protein
MKKSNRHLPSQVAGLVKGIVPILLFLTIFTVSGTSQVIGKITDKKPVLTANRDTMIQNLEKTLKKHLNITVKFNAAEIVTANSNYYIVFKGSEYTTRLQLIAKNGNLVASAISCTTNSCASSSGCTPDFLGRSCSACSGDCLKVTSSFQLGEATVLNN